MIKALTWMKSPLLKKAEDFVLILVISKNKIDTKCDTIYNIVREGFECQMG